MTGQSCAEERRRLLARQAGSNGLDTISLGTDPTRISVLLLGEAPADLTPGNVRIDAEEGARPVTVLAVERCPDPDPEDAECLLVTVEATGDRSCYTLAVVEADAEGHPTTTPLAGFDPRLSSLRFTFAEHCLPQLDCACPGPQAEPPAGPGPVIDYLSRDYASLRQQLLDRLALTMPEWTERHQADVGVTLVELLAHAGDLLHHRLDAVATESTLDTARLRTSLRRHARLVDHRVHEGAAARAFVCLDPDDDVTLPAGSFRFRAGDEVFEPLVTEDLELVRAHTRLRLWTWGEGECCLPPGATEAVLVAEDGVRLRAGDLLLLEELVGAVTGLAADADRSHRQVVRLLDVQADRDDLLDTPLLRVRWGADDALSFPLCVSTRGGSDCVELEVGVARGNLVVVGHGATTTWCQAPPEVLDTPPPPRHERGCAERSCTGCVPLGPVDRPAYPPRRRRHRIHLGARPVTRQAPWPTPAAVGRAQAEALAQVPGRARDRLVALAAAERLEEEDLAWLRTLFGPAALERYGVPDGPGHGIAPLLSGFDRLLAPALGRIDRLAARARGGAVLRQDVEGQELAWTWGQHDVVDLAGPGVRGPAAAVCAVDVREALPVVEVWSDDGTRWTPAHDLLAAGPDDALLVGEPDDEEGLWLRFGDGRAGRAPADGARLVASCKVGNGTRGNVGAEAIDELELCGVDAGTIRVRNPLPACGGRDPETPAEVRQRAPMEAFGTLVRAVTADDYARVAEALPGVQRAAASLRWTGAWYEAQVALDAAGTPEAGAALLTAAAERLHRVRRIGHDVHVGPARQVSLSLALCVRVEPDHVTGHVRGAVMALLGARPMPGGTALFAPDRLTFGTPVRLSAIVAAVAAVPGVEAVKVTRLARQLDPEDSPASARALAEGLLELDDLEVARLDNDPARPDHGLVALVIGGGR